MVNEGESAAAAVQAAEETPPATPEQPDEQQNTAPGDLTSEDAAADGIADNTANAPADGVSTLAVVAPPGSDDETKFWNISSYPVQPIQYLDTWYDVRFESSRLDPYGMNPDITVNLTNNESGYSVSPYDFSHSSGDYSDHVEAYFDLPYDMPEGEYTVDLSVLHMDSSWSMPYTVTSFYYGPIDRFEDAVVDPAPYTIGQDTEMTIKAKHKYELNPYCDFAFIKDGEVYLHPGDYIYYSQSDSYLDEVGGDLVTVFRPEHVGMTAGAYDIYVIPLPMPMSAGTMSTRASADPGPTHYGIPLDWEYVGTAEIFGSLEPVSSGAEIRDVTMWPSQPDIGYTGALSVDFKVYNLSEAEMEEFDSFRRAEVSLFRYGNDGTRALIDKYSSPYLFYGYGDYLSGSAEFNTDEYFTHEDYIMFTAGNYEIELELNPDSIYEVQEPYVIHSFTVGAQPELTGIVVTTPPVKTQYRVGDTLDLSGLAVTASYNDGGVVTLDAGDYTVVPAGGTLLDTAGTQTVTVSYEDCTAAFDVTVREPVETKVRVTTETIVATLEAYLNIIVTGEPEVLNRTKAYLAADGERWWETDIANGAGRMHIAGAPEAAGNYDLVLVSADNEDAVLASCVIKVTGYDTSIWTMNPLVSDDGYVTLRFNEPITARDGRFDTEVTINGNGVNCVLMSDGVTLKTDILVADLPPGVNSTITVSGVKYNRLFPGYSFTFTAWLTHD